MKKIERLNIKYLGYNAPENMEELELEILGLRTVISSAYQRIALLEQSGRLQNIISEGINETVAEAGDTKNK